MEIKYDSRMINGWINNMQKKQLPYATSRALNDTAFMARKEIIEQLPKRFIIRNTWTQKGIRVIKSHKSQWPDVHAEIGSVDYFMKYQELGAVRKKNKKAISIPKEIRSDIKQSITRAKKPAAILSKSGKNRPYIGKTSKGKSAIFKPISKTKRKLLYVFESQIVNKPRPIISDVTRQVTNGEMFQTFKKYFEKAFHDSKS
jgi:hypothetical protein